MSNDILDFSQIVPVEGGLGKYLKPGIYAVKPSEIELIEKEGSNSAIKITFSAVNEPYEGSIVEERFYLTPKALPRLQYLHEKYFGARLENKAITFAKLTEYLKAKMLTKPKTLLVVVGGRQDGDKIYGSLPYSDFVADENAEEGAFEEGSAEYNRVIRKNNNASTRSNSAILSNATSVSLGDKMPWDND